MTVNAPVSISKGDTEDAIDLRSVAFVLKRQSRVILGIAAAILLLTTFVVFTITPRYTATVQLMLDPHKQNNIIGPEALIGELPFDQTSVDNQAALIQSPALLARVVESEKLVDDAEFGRNAPQSIVARLRSLFSNPGAEAVRNSDNTKARSGGIGADAIGSIAALQGQLSVGRVGRTYILAVSLTSLRPEKAARLADAIANAYTVDQLEARFQAARRTSEWLAGRLERLRAELRESEAAVTRYRTEHNLGAEVSGAVSEGQLADLNNRLAAARAETAEKKAKIDQAQRILQEGGNLQSLPDVGRSNIMQNLKTQQADVSRREADLVARYSDHHPSVVNVRSERQDIERQIRTEVNRVIANLQNDYDVAKSRQQSLEKSAGVITGRGGIDNAVAIQLHELERVAAANKSLYESFLSKFKLSEEEANLQVREVRIIAPAAIPTAPSFPHRSLAISLALIFGLGAGVGIGFLLEALRKGFNTAEEVEELLGVPVLASVPLLSERDVVVDGKSIFPHQYLATKPLSHFSEAVRSARAGVQMSDVDQPPKVIQVSSAVAGEGKSTVAISLAQSAAMSLPRVLLVDCDLRLPAVSKIFRLEKRPGLVDLLTGSSDAPAILRDPLTGIYVMGAGSSTQNPPDLLSSARMRALVEQLAGSYDYIVIDSPPVGPVIDAVVLSSLVDKVVLVIAFNETPREIVVRAVKRFAEAKKIAGALLNRVDAKQSYGGYYNQYYKNYYTN
jgi:polysaccharide biosynthesis transport protein